MLFVISKRYIRWICIIVGIAIFGCSIFFVASAVLTDSPQPRYVVVLDAGHGGIDGGSSGTVTGVKESDLNLRISKKLEKYLTAMNVKVIQTRTTEAGLYGAFASGFKMVDMKERAKIINKANPDLVVSIHMNSFPQSSSRGAQVFFAPGSELSKKLATDMQGLLYENIEHARSSCLVGDYYILQCSPAPSVLVECGFLSNPEEEQLLISDAYQEKLSYQLFCGIMHYFDIKN